MNIYFDKLWEHETFLNFKIFELEAIYIIFLSILAITSVFHPLM